MKIGYETKPVKIKSITKRYFRGKVYNLETEDCHTYFAENTLVHNCSHADCLQTAWMELLRSGQIVKAATFSDNAVRISLVQAKNWLKQNYSPNYIIRRAGEKGPEGYEVFDMLKKERKAYFPFVDQPGLLESSIQKVSDLEIISLPEEEKVENEIDPEEWDKIQEEADKEGNKNAIDIPLEWLFGW